MKNESNIFFIQYLYSTHIPMSIPLIEVLLKFFWCDVKLQPLCFFYELYILNSYPWDFLF